MCFLTAFAINFGSNAELWGRQGICFRGFQGRSQRYQVPRTTLSKQLSKLLNLLLSPKPDEIHLY